MWYGLKLYAEKIFEVYALIPNARVRAYTRIVSTCFALTAVWIEPVMEMEPLQSTPVYLANGAKRAAPSPTTTQASDPSTTVQTPRMRPKKRRKLALEVEDPVVAREKAVQLAKRVKHPGALRRLALPRPALPAVRPKSTLAGAKVGGKAKDLKLGSISTTPGGVEGERRGTVEEMWIGRKGMSFGGWLKSGVAAFVQRGYVKNDLNASQLLTQACRIKTVHIHAMSAAMPMALSVAMAIRDAVPGGGDVAGGAILLQVQTGSIAVADEITPDDEVSPIL